MDNKEYLDTNASLEARRLGVDALRKLADKVWDIGLKETSTKLHFIATQLTEYLEDERDTGVTPGAAET